MLYIRGTPSHQRILPSLPSLKLHLPVSDVISATLHCIFRGAVDSNRSRLCVLFWYSRDYRYISLEQSAAWNHLRFSLNLNTYRFLNSNITFRMAFLGELSFCCQDLLDGERSFVFYWSEGRCWNARYTPKINTQMVEITYGGVLKMPLLTFAHLPRLWIIS